MGERIDQYNAPKTPEYLESKNHWDQVTDDGDSKPNAEPVDPRADLDYNPEK